MKLHILVLVFLHRLVATSFSAIIGTERWGISSGGLKKEMLVVFEVIKNLCNSELNTNLFCFYI